MDILSLILSCSLSIKFDDNLIQSIIMNESFNNPIYVRVEGSKFGVGYQNKDDSISAINEIMKSGKESYIGLMGIPLSDAINNGYTANDLLDECLNIQLGTANIDIFMDHCKAEGKIDISTCSIKKYAKYTGQKSISFTNKVIHKGIQFVSKSNQKNENFLIKNQSVHLDIGKGKRSKESVFIDFNIDKERGEMLDDK
jgi:hypothetical protein